MLKRSLPLCFVTLASFAQGNVPPQWVNTLPAAPGRVYAMGTASVAPSEAKALEQAAQNARFEVIARLRVKVEGSTTIKSTYADQQASGSAAIANRSQYVRQDGVTSIKAVDLPGLVVEERWLDRKANTAYALAYLDAAVAESTLADQMKTLGSDWKALVGEPADPGMRPSITRLQKIRSLRTRATELESQAGLLIPAGTPASLRDDLHGLGQAMDREITASQKRLTMGAKVQGGDLNTDILALMRNTAIQQGFVWNQQSPAITLLIELRSGTQGINIGRKAWWDVTAQTPDMLGIRANIRVTLSDASGDLQDSFDLQVKGVGTDAISAENALMKEVKKALPARFQTFLAELVKGQ